MRVTLYNPINFFLTPQYTVGMFPGHHKYLCLSQVESENAAEPVS